MQLMDMRLTSQQRLWLSRRLSPQQRESDARACAHDALDTVGEKWGRTGGQCAPRAWGVQGSGAGFRDFGQRSSGAHCLGSQGVQG